MSSSTLIKALSWTASEFISEISNEKKKRLRFWINFTVSWHRALIYFLQLSSGTDKNWSNPALEIWGDLGLHSKTKFWHESTTKVGLFWRKSTTAVHRRNLKTQQSPVILHLICVRVRLEQGNIMIIVTSSFSKNFVFKMFFAHTLVWTEGVTGEIKPRFQIPLAQCGRGPRKSPR